MIPLCVGREYPVKYAKNPLPIEERTAAVRAIERANLKSETIFWEVLLGDL